MAAKPPPLKFAIDVESLPTVEQVPVLRLLGECEHDDVALFEHAKKQFRADPPTEVDAAVEWILAALLDAEHRALPWTRLLATGIEAAFSKRTLERARAKISLVRIPPQHLRDNIGEKAYASLDDLSRKQWWVALPDFIPPPEDWE